jgi:hypothetical protein
MMEVEDLERRVRRLEDESSLRALLCRYSFNADLGRSRDYVDLYTEDGAVDIVQPNPLDGRPDTVRFEGHEELLVKFITGIGHRNIEGRCQHYMREPLILYIDGDVAEAEGYSFVLAVEGPSGSTRQDEGRRIIEFVTAAFNHWRFRRVGLEWKIVEFISRPIGSEYAQEITSKFLSQLR